MIRHIKIPENYSRRLESGQTALDGSFPVNMSGGVLSSNPIGASGLLRFAEAAMQVRGTAGECGNSTGPDSERRGTSTSEH